MVFFIAILITNSIAVYAVNDYWPVEYETGSYSTTEYFYPDAHVESTSVDGWMRGLSGGQTWHTKVVNETGSGGTDDGEWMHVAYTIADGTTNKWYFLGRAIFLFDTSSLPDDADIEQAVISLYGSAKKDTVLIELDVNIYSSEPASNDDLVNGDFQTLGTTAYSTAIEYNDWSIVGYNDFILNDNGISAISLTGVSKFGSRNACYDVADELDPNNHDPDWYSTGDATSSVSCYTAEKGGNYRPRLAVTYATECYIPLEPYDLELTDLGGNTVEAIWSMGANATETLVIIKREKYHTGIGTGEVAYNGTAPSCNITGLNLDYVKYCLVLYGKNACGYSENYTSGEIGGEAMQDTVIMVLPVFFGLALIGLNIFLKRPLLYLMVIPCMIAIVMEPALKNAWIQTSAVGVMIWCVLAFVMRMKQGVEG